MTKIPNTVGGPAESQHKIREHTCSEKEVCTILHGPHASCIPVCKRLLQTRSCTPRTEHSFPAFIEKRHVDCRPGFSSLLWNTNDSFVFHARSQENDAMGTWESSKL